MLSCSHPFSRHLTREQAVKHIRAHGGTCAIRAMDDGSFTILSLPVNVLASLHENLAPEQMKRRCVFWRTTPCSEETDTRA